MSPFKIPPIDCPLDLHISPHIESLHQQSMRWVCAMGLVCHGTAAYENLDAARLATLAAYIQPFGSLDDIQLQSDLTLWLFVHDDRYVDGAKSSHNPQTLAALHRPLFAVLDGRCPEALDAIARALQDICRRIAARSNAVWLQRFALQVKQYLQANAWEQAIGAQGGLPDLATYMKMRLFTGGVYTSFAIVDLTNDINPGAAFLQHAYLQALTDMANLHICWVNDILSLERELDENNPSNLVRILQQTHSSSIQKAVDRAVGIVNQEMAAFLRLKAMLPAFEPGEDEQVRRYINGLEQWMRGHIDWSLQARRYRSKHASVRNSMYAMVDLV